MKNLNRVSRINLKLQKGMTLIELAIVGLFLGLLALFAVSQFSGSATDSTKALGLYEASGKIADNWSVIAQSCGTSTEIVTSAITTTPTAARNLSLVLGNVTPDAAFTQCYAASGVRPLSGLTTGGAGVEQVYGYAVSATNSTVGTPHLRVTYAAVPENLVLALYNKYSSVAAAKTAATLPAAVDITDPQIQFSAATAGTRVLTILRPL